MNDYNHLIYERWHDRSPHEVLAWHRQVQEDLLTALREAPDEWFSVKERGESWPFDIDGHSGIGSKTSSGRSHIQPGTSPPGNAPAVSMLLLHQEQGRPGRK